MSAAIALLPHLAVADPGLVCDGGTNDGNECTVDNDCPGGGFCISLQLCSGGTKDGQRCFFGIDCPNNSGGTDPSAACVFSQNVCDVASSASSTFFCSTNADCPTGVTCTPTQKICSGGDNSGLPCNRPEQCPGAQCTSNSRLCFGGDFDHSPCATDDDCQQSGGASSSCQVPSATIADTFLCSAGSNDGGMCPNGDNDCPGGACVFGQTVCSGGTVDGFFCFANTDCLPDSPCVPTRLVCSAGSSKGFPCLHDPNCSGGSCIANGMVCVGGDSDFDACVNGDDCPGGTCESPGGPVGSPTPTPVGPTHTRTPTTAAGVPTRTPTRTPTGGPTIQPTRRFTPVPTLTRTRTPVTSGPGPNATATLGPPPPTCNGSIVNGQCVGVQKHGGCSAGNNDSGSGLSLISALALFLWRRRAALARSATPQRQEFRK